MFVSFFFKWKENFIYRWFWSILDLTDSFQKLTWICFCTLNLGTCCICKVGRLRPTCRITKVFLLYFLVTPSNPNEFFFVHCYLKPNQTKHSFANGTICIQYNNNLLCQKRNRTDAKSIGLVVFFLRVTNTSSLTDAWTNVIWILFNICIL